MEPYLAFSDDAVHEGATPWERSLKGWTQATIPRKTQPAPAKDPAEELAPAEVSTEEATPIEELAPAVVPTKEAAPIEEPIEEVPPIEVPTKGMAPTKQLPALKATISEPAGDPDIPPVWHENKRKGEAPHSDFPGWTEVLHPTQLMTSARETPLPSSNLRQRHHSQSVGEGEPDVREQKNADKLCKKGQVLSHHQGLLSQCQRSNHPQASRELQPAYWGNHPWCLPLKHPLR